MEIIRNPKFQILALLFLLFLAGITIYAKFAGLLLILSLFVFGTLSIIWHEKEIKIAGLGALVLLSLICIGINGMKFGIDFSGGTRIPVVLDQPVDSNTMNEMVQTIKKRASLLGLTEVKVRAIGSTEIDVEIPGSDELQISFIEQILAHQGVYQGIVDGKIAITGEDVYSTSIRQMTAQEMQSSGNDWGVSFSINKDGGDRFAKAVKGKANYPLYMFLDRPTDAAVFISFKDLSFSAPAVATKEQLLKQATDALKLTEGGNPIPVYLIDELKNISAPATNKTKAIISSQTPQELKDRLVAAGYNLAETDPVDFTPQFESSRTSGEISLQQWKAVGLLSSPFLAPSVTTGVPGYYYSIGGPVKAVPGKSAAVVALENVKTIESVLKGGSLPVQISLGSRTTLPASLGSEFLRLSLIGIGASLVAISILMGIRYRHMKAVLPIVVISASELVILLAILGSFTIDLAAMAGILAAIGVGVDAQIVITDEILKKDGLKLDDKMAHAFDIIKTNVVVAIIAMVPLLFSGLVEIIGFAISTILGSLLGFLISRPAYAVIVEKILEE
jgi:preprotein translocase subunit SecD